MTAPDRLSLAWLEWLRAERDVAPATVKARERALRSLGNAGTATREEVEEWWETRRHLSRATRNADLSHLRVFYAWCRTWDHRTDDPTARIRAPKMPKGLPRPVSRADFLRLLDQLEPNMRRAVCLGGWAGLRISETAVLDWSDVDEDAHRIRVEDSKGGKTRVVGAHAVLLDSLLPNTGGNVVTAGGKPYSVDVLSRRVNRAIRRAGVDATYHQLRHRFATIALAETGNLLAVSRALGHSSPATTAVYAELADTDLDRIAAAVVR